MPKIKKSPNVNKPQRYLLSSVHQALLDCGLANMVRLAHRAFTRTRPEDVHLYRTAETEGRIGWGTARLPKGIRIYAIGDMHGCDALVMRMIDLIRLDIRQNGGDQECVVIGLGDYIDRGDASAALLGHLADLSSSSDFRFIAIKGNHEDLFIGFLDNPDEDLGWLEMGGMETLWSFGVRFPAGARRPRLRELRDALVARMPPHVPVFLQNLRTHVEFGDFFFSHAGARPGIALVNQKAHDLMWYRFNGRDPDTDFGKLLVHGHTPVRTPEFRANRVNIDTGAYATGRLTCLVLQGQDRRIIEVASDGSTRIQQVGVPA